MSEVPQEHRPSLEPISPERLSLAAATLLDAAPEGSDVILFGSYARGDADAASDADYLVVEPEVRDSRSESVRLSEAIRPLRIPADVIVVSRHRFERWKAFPGNVIAEAAREGTVFRRGA